MYELTQLFWYKPIFMTELLLAEVVFALHLKRRSLFPLRLIAALVLCYGAAFAFPIPVYNAAWCAFLFFGLFAICTATMLFLFKEKWTNILFCSISAYTIQHIAFQLYDFLVNAFDIAAGTVSGIYGPAAGTTYAPFTGPVTELLYLLGFVIVYFMSYIFLGRRIERGGELHLKRVGILVFLTIFIVIDIVLSSLATYYAEGHFDRFWVSLVDFFNISCCLLALTFLFELPTRKKLEDELAVIETLYRQSEKQYSAVKENVELINLRCHDLKHYIHSIGSAEHVMDDSTVKEIEEAISIYDSTVKTGNDVLDIILTEKSLLCHSKDIRLSCIIDGQQLDFMSDGDIYVLFGNLLDNAVEAVLELEKEKRTVGVIVRASKGFLSVNVHNPCKVAPLFVDGLPQTTRADKLIHGYGSKSIRLVAEKYGGEPSYCVEGGVFSVSILFPLGGK